jgi:oligopeptide transport system ATP-binding protein
MSSSKTLLKVRNLYTSFHMMEGTIRAVKGISFSIKQGEMLGVVGESGCGKSVTGLSIMRLVPFPGRVTDGEIMLEDRNLLSLPDEEMRLIRGSSIAMIFQDPMTSLNPVLTVSRQMTEAITTHTELKGREARSRAVELLGTVGIPSPEKRISDYPHQFSGGMRQRVMIAMALSCRPRILIADEPTTALDVTIQAQILELMKKVCDEIGTSIMFITHDLGIVAGLCRQVAVMYAGCFVEMTDVDEMFANPRHPYTYGLLTSTPRMDRREDRLQPIGGMPPSLLDPPARCLFAPRCEFAVDRCWNEIPQLDTVKTGHTVACFRSNDSLW